MKLSNYRLTISFPVSILSPEGIDVGAAVPAAVSRDTYEDGRHDLPYEMVADGIGRIIQAAAFNAAEAHFRSIHGDRTEEDYEVDGMEGRRNVANHRAAEWVKHQFDGVMVEAGGWQASMAPDTLPR